MSYKADFAADPEGTYFGAQAAFQAAIRAIISSHPDPQRLMVHWEREQETSMAWLLHQPTKNDAAIHMFEAMLGSMASAIPGLKSPPQRDES